MPDQVLAGKVALITGGARRVGAQVVRRLHAEGMNAAVHYHSSEDQAHALQRELHEVRGDSILLLRGNLLGGPKLLQNLVYEAVEAFGRLDVVINNASTFYPTAVTEATEKQWNDLIGTNLKTPFFLAQAAADQLKTNHGCIVNIADIHGERPLKGHPIYSVAKAGLIMLTRALARELAPEVRVNAVAPGAIMWPEDGPDEMAKHRIISRTALKRAGDPDDIARTVLFLVRDASYITGQLLAVDGGRSIVL
ncbi:MAG: pteridine reductase [Acidiferrobacterales bacterium]